MLSPVESHPDSILSNRPIPHVAGHVPVGRRLVEPPPLQPPPEPVRPPTPEILVSRPTPLPLLEIPDPQTILTTASYELMLEITGHQAVEPGSVLTLAAVIRLDGPNALVMVEDLELPHRWDPIFGLEPFLLETNRASTRLLALRIPARTPAGEYDVAYTVASGDDSVNETTHVRVGVLERPGLETSLKAQPGPWFSGSTHTTEILYRNTGNTSLDVAMTAVGSGELFVDGENDALVLAPGESQLRNVLLTVPPDLHMAAVHYLRVEATGTTPSGAEVHDRSDLDVEVIPLAPTAYDRWHRIPARLTTGLVSNRTGTSEFFEFETAGYLDDQRRRRFDVRLRGPDNRLQGAFGQQDRYSATLSDERMLVEAGDHGFRLSHLTDPFAEARGLTFEWRFDYDTAAGVHLSRDRWDDLRRRRVVYARTQLARSVSVRGGYLDREAPDGAADGGRLVSLTCELRPWSRETLTLEGALADADAGSSGGGDDAWRLLFQSHRHAVDLRIESIQSDRRFPGAFPDLDLRSAWLRVRPGAGVTGQLLVQQSQHADDSGNRNELTQGGLTWRPDNRATTFRLEGRESSVSSFTTPSGHGLEEQSLQLGVDHRSRKRNLGAQFEIGRQRDWDGDEHGLVRVGATSMLVVSNSTDVTFGGQLSRDDDVGGGFLGSGTHLWGRLTWQPNDDLRVALHGSAKDIASDTRQSTHQYDLLARWRMTNIMDLDLRLRSQQWFGAGEHQVAMVSLTRHFGLPVSRHRDRGSVEGVVVDEDRSDHPGLGGIIVRLGGLGAVSDQNGRFSFPSLPPGLLPLDVDRVGAGFGHVMTRDAPRTVDVTGGRTTHIRIPLTRSASVAGHVIRMRAEGGDTDTDTGDHLDHVIQGDESLSLNVAPGRSPQLEVGSALANVLVILDNGVTRRRIRTDSRGGFRIDDLIPGRWTVHIPADELPAHHEQSGGPLVLYLAPGITADVEVRVAPFLRPIRIIDQKNLISGATVEPDARISGGRQR